MRNFKYDNNESNEKYLCTLHSEIKNVHYNPHEITKVSVIDSKRSLNELEPKYLVFVTFADNDGFLLEILRSDFRKFCNELKTFGRGYLIQNDSSCI